MPAGCRLIGSRGVSLRIWTPASAGHLMPGVEHECPQRGQASKATEHRARDEPRGCPWWVIFSHRNPEANSTQRREDSSEGKPKAGSISQAGSRPHLLSHVAKFRFSAWSACNRELGIVTPPGVVGHGYSMDQLAYARSYWSARLAEGRSVVAVLRLRCQRYTPDLPGPS